VVSPLRPDLRTFADGEALSQAVARSLADNIKASVAGGSPFFLVLSGGRTPRGLYRLLATKYRDEIPWAQVHLFWADERYVPPDDPRSNYRLVRETLLDQIAIPAKNVHPMPTDFSEPEDAARAYEKTLATFFSPPWPHFHLVLLGLGADGHTASLFPGSAALEEKERWVVAVRGPVEPPLRLTLTLPVLTHSAQIYFLVSGAEKAQALGRALAGPPDPRSCPAGSVHSSHRAVVWFTDAAAAKLLP
jgi:6-phosphogluconolactonase